MWRCSLVIDDYEFPSSEHAYQFFKAKFCEEEVAASCIYNAVTGFEAKRLARTMICNPKVDQFREIKVQLMCYILEHKYVQNRVFRNALLPGNYYLEATHDTFWGCGYREADASRYSGYRALMMGKNQLGMAMTRIAQRGTLLRDDWKNFI